MNVHVNTIRTTGLSRAELRSDHPLLQQVVKIVVEQLLAEGFNDGDGICFEVSRMPASLSLRHEAHRE